MYLGSQVKPDKSLLKSIKDVVKSGGNVVQVFLRKMHSSSEKDRLEISVTEQKEIKDYLKKNKIKGFVHGSYLLNFCRVPEGLIRIQWAYKILKEDMELAEKLGMKGVVIHMCSRNAVDEKWKPITLTLEETIDRNIKHIEYFFKKNPSLKTKLLLEISSSEGNKIGGNLKDFGKVFKPLYKKFDRRIGVCLDTCHAFVSGYPINTVNGMKNFFEDYKKYVGSYDTISVIHLNDAAAPLGSKKDRHAEIGKGFIFKGSNAVEQGKEALCYIVNFAIKNKIPMCLETYGGYKREFNLINKLCLDKHVGGEKIDGKNITKTEVINILEEFKEYHKSLGNNIKAMQYSKAINSIKSFKIKKIKSGQDLIELPFVGKGIVSKIDEFIKTGKIKLLEDFRNNPIVLAQKELTTVYGIGPKKAKELISKGIYSVQNLKQDLKQDLKKSKIKLTDSQLIGLKYYNDLKKRIPRKESEKTLKLIEKEFKKLYGKDAYAILAGSYARGKKTSGDIDILLSIKKLDNTTGILKDFVQHLFENNILVDTLSGTDGNNYMGIIKIGSKPHRHIDLHMVKDQDVPFHILYFSSGEQFSRMIRQKAKEQGYKLNDKGLFKNGKRVNVKTEKNVFNKLKLKWVPFEKR